MIDTTLHYHLVHPGGDSSPGDPNAAFYLDGVYHLHYILAHPWRQGRSYSFVHVTSPDMVHWTWQPTKLQPSFTGHGMFSGTGFVTREGVPAVIYHGQASSRNQIAIAKDRRLSAWERPYTVDVLMPDGSEAEIERHWDPDCFLVGDTYYALSGGVEQPLFKSTDLRNWTYVGNFLSHDLPDVSIGEDISCPNFFQLGNKWMLLCISHPLGCRYYIGDWDPERETFVPQTHERMNYRRDGQPVYGCGNRTDFFAPESVQTPDGRRVMWAWLHSAGPDAALSQKTIQSLPRELSLRDDGTLRIAPLRELEGLRYDHVSMPGVSLSVPITDFGPLPPAGGKTLERLAVLPGDACEIRVVVPRATALRKLFGFMLSADADSSSSGLPIVLRPETGTVRVGTTDVPFSADDLREDEDVELRIFIDKYLVEVFISSRRAVVCTLMDRAGPICLDAFTVGAPTEISSLEIWKLQPSNQGFLEATANRCWEPDTH